MIEKIDDGFLANKYIAVRASANKRQVPFELSLKKLKKILETKKCFFTGAELNRINEDPNQYSELLGELGMIPPPLIPTFELPAYVTASVPSEDQWQNAVEWAVDKGLAESQPAYSDSINNSFLPY